MRILHVIRTLDPAWGGPVEGLRNLATQALGRGHQPEVVCADDSTSPWLASWNSPEPGLLRIHPVGRGRVSKYGFTNELSPWLVDNLPRFDVVVVHGIWMHFSYAVWKATREIKIPYFLFIHGALDPWFKRNYPLRHIKKTLYWKLIEHKILRDAEKVLFTTEEEMIQANRAFLPWQCRSEVSGYGIARPEFPEASADNPQIDRNPGVRILTKTCPLLGNRRFILFLSRVHEKKGIDLLLKAFAASKQALPHTALVVAGPGEQNILNQLQQLAASLGIADIVIWTGPLYGADKWNMLRAAEACILPSHQENFGISVVEALACGVPVLVSDKVNIWREIRDAHAGFVAPDDVAGTTRLLLDWAALSSGEKSEMGANARRCFSTKFDIAVTSGRYFALLENGLTRPPRDLAVAVAHS